MDGCSSGDGGSPSSSSLSQTNRNWGGEHLCPGVYYFGQRKHKSFLRRCCMASGVKRVNGSDGVTVEDDCMLAGEVGVVVRFVTVE